MSFITFGKFSAVISSNMAPDVSLSLLPGPLITHMLDLTVFYVSWPVFCIAIHLSFLLFSDHFFWPNIVHHFFKLKLSFELLPLVIIFSNSDTSFFFFYSVQFSVKILSRMFYFFYFLECGSTITLKSLVMTTSRTSVGLFLLCVDFSVFFFFFNTALYPFCLSIFCCALGTVFAKLLAESTWDLQWNYFPSKKVSVCFCRAPGTPAIQDYLNLISELWNT